VWGVSMRLIIGAIALVVIGALVGTIAVFVLGKPAVKLAEGELRCEGAGAVIIKVAGKDYAVNGMASRNYPIIQTIWNETTGSKIDIGRLIAQGLTLCDWHTAATK
jgi:hypothetical protein